MLSGCQSKHVRTKPPSLGPDLSLDPSSSVMEFRDRTSSDASRASRRPSSWRPSEELIVPRVSSNICGVCAGGCTSQPPMPGSNVPRSCVQLGNLIDEPQPGPDRPASRPDSRDAIGRVCSSSSNTRQMFWLPNAHCCSWRHSDPCLAGFSIPTPGTASSSGLPVCDCHGYIGPGDEGIVDSRETLTFPKCGSNHEQTPDEAGPRGNIKVCADFERQRLVYEMEYLCCGPANPRKPFYQSGPVTWSSSSPDLCIDYPHFIDVDCCQVQKERCRIGSDDCHDDTKSERVRHDSRLSKRSNVFCHIFSHQRLGGPQRLAGQNDPLERRCSMDSQILYRSRLETVRPLSRRTIRISSPGHANTMFISGVDTLGGLPDSEGQTKRPFSETRFPVSSCSQSHEIYLYSHHRRRSSCPVIFESEESRECSSPRKLRSHEQETNLYSSISSFSSSEELEPGQAPREAKLSGKSGQFFLGNAPLEASGSMTTSRAGHLLAGVTFIVDQQSRTGGDLGAEVARDCGSDRDVLSSVGQQTGNRKRAQTRQAGSLGDKSSIQDLTKLDTLVRTPGSRTASVSRSQPFSGRSSPSSRPMSRACTDSSSSSLTVDEDGPGQHSAQSSATSSADDIA